MIKMLLYRKMTKSSDYEETFLVLLFGSTNVPGM